MNISRKLILLTLIVLCGAGSSFAQSAKLKRAKKYMDDLNYSSAIEVYNQILEKKEVPEAKINLAECYRKIGDAYNAEYWYAQVVQLTEAQPVHKLYYGMALQKNGKCALAKPWYEAYLEAVPNDVRGMHLARACDYEEELKAKGDGIYQIRNLPFNSDLDDFSPAMYGKSLVFASDRDRGAAVKREHSWTGSPFNELYVATIAQDSLPLGSERYGKPEKFSKDLNTRYHDAAVAFTPDGREIYYTRNNVVKGKLGKDDQGVTRLKVFYATNQGDDHWSETEGLPFNSDQYSVAHPCLTPDGGRIFFASDMPGGFGGMDLYYSDFENGQWGPAINMGNKINTEGNELFPTWQGDSTFYFASDGHIGLGGLDIYRMTWNEEGNQWSEVENLGAPINSTHDDLGMVLNREGTFGYFSSDRPGGVGRDDLYSFVKTAAPVEVRVFDALTGKPIKGAQVTHTCAVGERLTDGAGIVRYEIKLNSCCDYTARFEGYDDHTEEGCTEGLTNEPVIVEIPLRRSVQITLKGIVFDLATGLPVEGASVQLTSNCEGEEHEPVITGSDGKYMFALRRDCCYEIRAEKTDYLAAVQADICTQAITEDAILDANLYLQPTTATAITQEPPVAGKVFKDPVSGRYIDPRTGKPANGVIDGITYMDGKISKESPWFETSPTTVQPGDPIAYLLHIYYDFDRAQIRDEALPELTKLLAMLQDNPLLIIEIASHTDARGSHRYNRRLSQRRADAVVDWLVQNGISMDRLVPRGYGETQPVNDCVNNIPCNEKKHQLNRRTEFRILGCLGCVEPDQARISRPNENPHVDPCKKCPF